MQPKPLTETLLQMTRFHFVNAYLVREDDGLTLIDTTLGRAADALIAAAAHVGGTIRRIALTHGHIDHAGSADALKERLGDTAELLIPELDARILAGEKVLESKPPGGWGTLKCKPDAMLSEGDRVGSLEVIAAPGHTPGHVAFLDTRDRALIAGDVFTSYGGLAVTTHFHLRFPFAATATWDKAKDVESARKLRALRPTILVVGHGPAVREPDAQMEKAIANARG